MFSEMQTELKMFFLGKQPSSGSGKEGTWKRREKGFGQDVLYEGIIKKKKTRKI